MARVLLGSPGVIGKRVLVYYLPGDECTGILMYRTTATNFREIESALDASAMKTGGLKTPPDPPLLLTILFHPLLPGVALMALLLAGGVALAVSLKRREAKIPPRPPGPRRYPPARPKR